RPAPTASEDAAARASGEVVGDRGVEDVEGLGVVEDGQSTAVARALAAVAADGGVPDGYGAAAGQDETASRPACCVGVGDVVGDRRVQDGDIAVVARDPSPVGRVTQRPAAVHDLVARDVDGVEGHRLVLRRVQVEEDGAAL